MHKRNEKKYSTLSLRYYEVIRGGVKRMRRKAKVGGGGGEKEAATGWREVTKTMGIPCMRP